MSFESGTFKQSGLSNEAGTIEEVRLRLPGVFSVMPEEQKARFDDIMMRVIPWRGEGYVLGLNGLYDSVPGPMLDELTQYLNSDFDDAEAGNAVREELTEKFRNLFSEKGFGEMSHEQLRRFA